MIVALALNRVLVQNHQGQPVHIPSKLTDERLVVVDGGPDIPAPSPDDHGVVDVVVEALADVDGLRSGRPQLQRYPHLSRARGTIITYGT